MADRTGRVGQPIGDYVLLRRLGGGSFGDVYLGEHIRTQEQVAVKVLQARLIGKNELKEFINEARTFRLRHPHIIQLLDFGIDNDDIPYLVMEYASHGTLHDKHPRGRQVPLSTVISYVTPLASALQYAHDQQLIHRDVKPENMLLSENDNVLLSDFGIATVAHSSRSLNTQEGLYGTIPYMAPEQIQGKPRPASDQYALGIVVYKWITGERPFKGTATEVAIQHSMKPPPPLREQVPTLSADVEQVVLKALAKEPKERFDNITDFATALEQASKERKVVLRVEPPPVLRSSPQPNTETPIPATKPVKVVVPPSLEKYAAEILPSPVPPHATPPLSTQKITRTVPAPTPLHATPPLSSQKIPRTVPAPEISQPVVLPRTLPPPHKTKNTQLLALVFLSLAILVISGIIGLSVNTIQTSIYNANTTATVSVAAARYNTAIATNGSMFGFDAQHTRTNPFERILSPATVAGLKPAWNSVTGSSPSSSPTVANGMVYVGSDDHKLYAYKATGCSRGTCSPIWSSDPTGDLIESSPGVANGIVYVGSDDAKIYAYKAGGCGKSTCPPIWSSDPTGGPIFSSPSIANGIVYASSNDQRLYAYNAGGCGSSKSTCPPLWSSDLTGSLIDSSAAVANGIVYVGSWDGKLYAYKADGCGSSKSTCPPLWSSDSTGDAINSSAAVANGIVYIGSWDGKLYAYKADGCGSGKSTCPPLWSSDSTGSLINSSPAVANGIVYVGSDDSEMYAYKADGCNGKSTCSPLWSSDPTGYPLESSPTVANGIVYIDGYAYKADGCGSGKGTCPPLWSSNLIDSPSQTTSIDPMDHIKSSPAVANGIVYVGGDGFLHAFQL
jgi:eukaryotic-like serine/threonine-protein kinase